MSLTSHRKYINFINDYKKAKNAATGSKYDSNANVENKNVATLSSEIFKRDYIEINRTLMHDKISQIYGNDLADEYIRQLEHHEIYKHDETSIMPYCVSITMYPFLFEGLKGLNGYSIAPNNLYSFAGSFINLVFMVASQFAGAVSTPEFIPYLDYFIRKEFGDDYYYDSKINSVINKSLKERTIDKIITDIFSQIIYSINTPASARGYQCVFWNIAYFDEYYFKGMFENFAFPDGSPMIWESTSWLQKRFMNWFNEERRKAPLTFPVETMSLLNDENGYKDEEYKNFTAEMWSKGHSFFVYRSDNVDSLSSCCRLRNEISDNTFSFTLGAGGVSTGSKGVITINVNRLVQNANKNNIKLEDAVLEQVQKVHKYLKAFNEIVYDNYKANLLTIYNGNFISLEKQYLTIGLNGFVEGAEFLGIEISDNDNYYNYVNSILKTIYEENKKQKTKDIMFNTEFTPCESLGVKNAKWDKEDGLFSPRDCYNSYFYVVENENTNIIDKLILHGDRYTKYLDGGSACHLNLKEHLSKYQYMHLLDIASLVGCNYFTFNIPNTICNSCGNIDKNRLSKCPKCGSEDIDYLTRIIGYWKKVSKFSEQRQKEESRRYYA